MIDLVGVDFVRAVVLFEAGDETADLALGLVVQVLADVHVGLVVLGRPEVAVVSVVLEKKKVDKISKNGMYCNNII